MGKNWMTQYKSDSFVEGSSKTRKESLKKTKQENIKKKKNDRNNS